METVLESGRTWFLGALLYNGCTGDLQIDILEGFRAEQSEDVSVGGVSLGKVHRLSCTESSRRMRVTFSGVFAYQLIDETYTSLDEYEEGERHFLSVFTRSRFRDFLCEHYPILPAVKAKEMRHYRLWTEGAVVDVIAAETPEVTEVCDKR